MAKTKDVLNIEKVDTVNVVDGYGLVMYQGTFDHLEDEFMAIVIVDGREEFIPVACIDEV